MTIDSLVDAQAKRMTEQGEGETDPERRIHLFRVSPLPKAYSLLHTSHTHDESRVQAPGAEAEVRGQQDVLQ